MKFFFYNLIIAAILIGFSSCKKESPDLGAKINVTVENAFGCPQVGTSIYMYKDSAITPGTKPADAEKLAISNVDGISGFELNFTGLSLVESQTPLYFAVFYMSGKDMVPIGSTAVTVKRHDVKSITLTIP